MIDSEERNVLMEKVFDYYPLRMKLFDYKKWHQLTYPFPNYKNAKWEKELETIINNLKSDI